MNSDAKSLSKYQREEEREKNKMVVPSSSSK